MPCISHPSEKIGRKLEVSPASKGMGYRRNLQDTHVAQKKMGPLNGALLSSVARGTWNQKVHLLNFGAMIRYGPKWEKKKPKGQIRWIRFEELSQLETNRHEGPAVGPRSVATRDRHPSCEVQHRGQALRMREMLGGWEVWLVGGGLGNGLWGWGCLLRWKGSKNVSFSS